MSLDTATDQIRAQLPQLGALGYKVKFAIKDTVVTRRNPAAVNDDAEANFTIAVRTG